MNRGPFLRLIDKVTDLFRTDATGATRTVATAPLRNQPTWNHAPQQLPTVDVSKYQQPVRPARVDPSLQQPTMDVKPAHRARHSAEDRQAAPVRVSGVYGAAAPHK